jgi:hypothetical protein
MTSCHQRAARSLSETVNSMCESPFISGMLPRFVKLMAPESRRSQPYCLSVLPRPDFSHWSMQHGSALVLVTCNRLSRLS